MTTVETAVRKDEAYNRERQVPHPFVRKDEAHIHLRKHLPRNTWDNKKTIYRPYRMGTLESLPNFPRHESICVTTIEQVPNPAIIVASTVLKQIVQSVSVHFRRTVFGVLDSRDGRLSTAKTIATTRETVEEHEERLNEEVDEEHEERINEHALVWTNARDLGI